jgi:excisionase family DNA binding protein
MAAKTKKRRMSRDTPDSADSLVLTIPTAGKLLGLSRDSAYGAVGRGEIPVLKFGKRLVVPRAALQRLIDGAKTKTA